MAFMGALVRKASDQTAANYSAADTVIAWDSEVEDTDGFHDTVTNNSRLTVTSSANGKYGIITAVVSIEAVTAVADCRIQITKNGSFSWIGWAGVLHRCGTGGSGQSTTQLWMEVQTPPVLLTTGDYFEVTLYSDDTSITVEASRSSFGIRVLNKLATQLCLAKKAADQTTANYSTPAVVAWDGTDVYDTNAIHDPASNNGKLIIPAALNGKHVIVTANINSSLAAGANSSLAIRKNGSLAYNGFGGRSSDRGNLSVNWRQCYTQPIIVATGDEFEALHYETDTSVTIESDQSSFGLIVVD